ncbi:unnamed protein product [Porites lobata]|uniref:VWFA domain-containing protein n=1 Tax=Porites lobata TaxID=104759 RepID=A0ABN8SAE0_9CNID|nr:unnamed protein product [Porites lobata]
MEMDSGYPAMEKVCFSFASQRQHFIVPDTVGALTNSMNLVLRIDPSECHFIKCEEVASNWFNLMFELPNRREVVDKLCLNALEKEPWLAQCGVRAVKIGDKSEIHMQTPITRSVPTSIAEANVPTSIAEANLPCSQVVSHHAPCLHDDRKLDLIVVVDCATTNAAILGQLKAQLRHMVDAISQKSAHFRLAIISYQNHPNTGRRVPTASVSNIASVVNFTDDKSKMKDNINGLRCFGNSGSRRGLADALALAVHLSNNNDDDDCNNDYKCRQEALTVCVLLPLDVQFGNLDIFKCTHGHDVLSLCRQLAANAVTLYVVLCRSSKPGIPPYLPNSGRRIDLMAEFFTGISLMTGGLFIYSESVKVVSEIISYIVEVDKSMERLFGTAHDIILDEIEMNDGDVVLEELLTKVQEELTKRSLHVNLIAINGSTIGPSSKLASKFSLDNSIDGACKTWQREVKKMRQADLAIASGSRGDVNMEEAAGPQVQLLEKQNVTREVSERMVRRVVGG